MTKSDTWIGLILMGVAVAALIPAWNFSSVPGMGFGAWTFPVVVLIGLACCGAILTIKSVMTGRDESKESTRRPYWAPGEMFGFSLILTAGVFYIIAAETLGFLITSSLIVFILSIYFWRRPAACLVLTLITVPVAEFIFAGAFSVPLPRGLISMTRLF